LDTKWLYPLKSKEYAVAQSTSYVLFSSKNISMPDDICKACDLIVVIDFGIIIF